MIGNRHSAAARFLLFILLCTTCTDAQDEEFVKLVGLVPVRDEAHLLPSCLRALSRLVHAIVVLDDCSVDGSAKVAHELEDECKIERVERSKTCKRDAKSGLVLPFWGNEAAHRSYLLVMRWVTVEVCDDDGRSWGGEVIEWNAYRRAKVVVGGGKKEELDEFRNIILRMKKGDLLVLHYITMFSSAKKFREDKADFKAVGFVDQNRARQELCSMSLLFTRCCKISQEKGRRSSAHTENPIIRTSRAGLGVQIRQAILPACHCWVDSSSGGFHRTNSSHVDAPAVGKVSARSKLLLPHLASSTS
eukprot:765316-Hanusia_phi.AAC.1